MAEQILFPPQLKRSVIISNKHGIYKSSILWSYLMHILSPSSKNKKNPPRKKFLKFREMKLPDSTSKKFLMFSYISGNGNHEKAY